MFSTRVSQAILRLCALAISLPLVVGLHGCKVRDWDQEAGLLDSEDIVDNETLIRCSEESAVNEAIFLVRGQDTAVVLDVTLNGTTVHEGVEAKRQQVGENFQLDFPSGALSLDKSGDDTVGTGVMSLGSNVSAAEVRCVFL
jgi:hypothetical protein